MKVRRIALAYGSLIIAAAMLMVHLEVSDGIALTVTIGLAVIDTVDSDVRSDEPVVTGDHNERGVRLALLFV